MLQQSLTCLESTLSPALSLGERGQNAHLPFLPFLPLPFAFILSPRGRELERGLRGLLILKGLNMHTLQKAKILRHNQTEAEQKMWYYLRAHRFIKFAVKPCRFRARM